MQTSRLRGHRGLVQSRDLYVHPELSERAET